MYTIDKQKAKERLVVDQKYLPIDADIALKDYPDVEEPLGAALKHWVETGAETDVNVEGISVLTVQKNYGYHYITAIKALNRLLDRTQSPEEHQKHLHALSLKVTYE